MLRRTHGHAERWVDRQAATLGRWGIAATLVASAGAGSAQARAKDAAPSCRNAPPPFTETWTSIPVPDRGTLYVRYGPPGGVAIKDSASAAPPTATVDRQRMHERIRQLVREELQRAAAAGSEPPAGRDERSRVSSLGAPAPAPAVRDDGRGSPVQVVVVQPPASAAAPAPAPVAATAPVPPPATPAEALPGPRPATEAAVALHEEVRRHLVDEGLLSTQVVLFATNRSTLLPSATGVLNAVGQVMQENPALRIRVEGHTDKRGSSAFNMKLSEARAASVRRYLLRTFSLPMERLEAVGFGEEDPVAAGMSATALALNRRVEFRVIGR